MQRAQPLVGGGPRPESEPDLPVAPPLLGVGQEGGDGLDRVAALDFRIERGLAFEDAAHDFGQRRLQHRVLAVEIMRHRARRHVARFGDVAQAQRVQPDLADRRDRRRGDGADAVGMVDLFWHNGDYAKTLCAVKAAPRREPGRPSGRRQLNQKA